MSIRAMSVVWDATIKPPTRKLTLLALADWSNDEGGSLRPSIARLAEKVGISRSQAQRVVHSFLDEGLLSVIGNEAGGRSMTRRYQLHLDRIGGQKGSTDAAVSDAERVAPVRVKGRTHAHKGSHPCDPNHHEPSGSGWGSVDAALDAPVGRVGALPEHIDIEAWQAVIDARPDLDANELLEAAALHHQRGISREAIAEALRNLVTFRHWKRLSPTYTRAKAGSSKRRLPRAAADFSSVDYTQGIST